MDKNIQNQLIKETLDLAQNNIANVGGGPFGAIIVKDNSIIARGVNTVTTTNDPTAHAEVNAIRLACKELNTFDLSGYEIYCSCEPCPMCLSAIYWARIEKVYYAADRFDAQNAGFDDSFIYEEFERPINERKIQFSQITAQDGREILRNWNECECKVKY